MRTMLESGFDKNHSLFSGDTASGKMQMSETIPSGANWCQQIPGKDNFTCCNLFKREISYLCLKIYTVKKQTDYFHGEISGKVSDEYAEKSNSKIK